VLASPKSGHNGLDFSRDGKHLVAIVSRDIKIFDISEDCRKQSSQLIRLNAENEEVRFSPDGKLILVLTKNSDSSDVVKIFNFSGNLLHTLPDDLVRDNPNDSTFLHIRDDINKSWLFDANFPDSYDTSF
jgi:6-phosphogluconolactonase (cycloisomerase 2 family)